MNGDTDTTTGTTADLLTRHWWVLALRGLAGAIFGVLAFMWPGITLFSLVILFGAYALVNGLFSFILAAKAPKGYPNFGSLILAGIFGVLAGLITFFWPGISALGLLIVIAAWAVVNGILEIYYAIKLRKEIKNEWLLILAGILSVIFGGLLLLNPLAGALVLVLWIGAFAIAFGILLIILAFKMKRLGHLEPAGVRTA
jgi:uncharacterized membrane protein HdeD (DUF308 family)